MKSPSEYRHLSYGAAVNTLTARIIELSGKEPFLNGKPIADFWRLRSYLYTQDRSRLNVLYDYLYTIEHSEATLGQLFVQAEQFRQQQQIKMVDVQPYKTITIGDVLSGD